MTQRRLAPCSPWERLPLCCDCLTATAGGFIAPGLTEEETTALIEETYAYVEALAFNKTKRQFTGECSEWVRPCPPCYCVSDCNCGSGYRPINLLQWTNGLPVIRIDGIRIDGVETGIDTSVDPADRSELDAMLRVDLCRDVALIAADGRPMMWPAQDYARPIGSPCTWELLVVSGEQPDIIVQTAVRDMVCEQLLKCLDLPCKLPDNIDSITEQGRTVKFRVPSDTNSGVDAWDAMCAIYGKTQETQAQGREFIRVPGGGQTRFIGGSPTIGG